ncbi:hypothetical protein CONLIGDRAFT_627134 [Coniochaeta ligniaria NRRL 30616]|uniref:RED-like N-terminal domain-containing protein n=1 Tax=Coniochaeta ligniaria NRRL 30616 TaxID=1408157 RepID=A0A1J7J4L1_9PEZI|nr:hypothetical protein CONLIGDRAFT_627134 [Coniochaeta ligniaria NRRL 30616]
MDNQAFKSLLLQNSNKNGTSSSSAQAPTPRLGGATPGEALGSRLKSSIPMTPRSVSLSARTSHRDDFARQLAEKKAAESGEPRAKKFRTRAPKGVRFGEGYVDRARQEREDGDDDERAERLKVLEKRYRDEEIDEAEYERLRGEIAGGDLGSTHLVKGLDFRLLERVRKGEDVFGEKGEQREDDEEEQEEETGEEDPDDVLEELAAEVKPVEKEKAQKKGTFAPASALAPGQKRSRNQILAELKAAREAAKAKAESSLGSKFKKIGERPKPGTRIERDGKGREVMIIVDEDGNERRKVRRVDPKAAQEEAKEEFKPEGEALGMEVPEFYRLQQAEKLARQKEEEEKEISIFDDAGSDYDPLAGMDGSSDESASEDEGEVDESKPDVTPKEGDARTAEDSRAMPPPPRPKEAAPARLNYFKDSKTGLISAESQKRPDLNDPAILAALRKARALDMQTKSEEEIKAAEREAKLKKMLEASSRDDADMDMGFGSSRLEDEADMDETKVKLSQWGEEDDDDEGGGGGGKVKRKRGGKKRKGDKDSFKDVMSVIERRKGDKA